MIGGATSIVPEYSVPYEVSDYYLLKLKPNEKAYMHKKVDPALLLFDENVFSYALPGGGLDVKDSYLIARDDAREYFYIYKSDYYGTRINKLPSFKVSIKSLKGTSFSEGHEYDVYMTVFKGGFSVTRSSSGFMFLKVLVNGNTVNW